MLDTLNGMDSETCLFVSCVESEESLIQGMGNGGWQKF